MADLDRLFLVVLGDLHSQDHRLEKALRGLGILLQHFAAGNQNALRDTQLFVEVDDKRETFVDEPDGVFGRERRGVNDAALEGNGAQRRAAYRAQRDVTVGIDVVALQKYSDGKIGVCAGAGDADDLAAQLFDGLLVSLLPSRV